MQHTQSAALGVKSVVLGLIQHFTKCCLRSCCLRSNATLVLGYATLSKVQPTIFKENTFKMQHFFPQNATLSHYFHHHTTTLLYITCNTFYTIFNTFSLLPTTYTNTFLYQMQQLFVFLCIYATLSLYLTTLYCVC